MVIFHSYVNVYQRVNQSINPQPMAPLLPLRYRLTSPDSLISPVAAAVGVFWINRSVDLAAR
jgi:hypothetical protein